jgi:NADPH:quinone reductase-like Zn-dependent oxidoreductase
MKAVRFHSYGDSSVLAYEDAPEPQIGANDLLVRVHAAGVNPVDVAVCQGYMSAWFPLTLPHIPGIDVSGVVEAVGSEVAGFQPGDEVFARTDLMRDGTYAEYVAIAATDVVPKPRNLDHVGAAALPHAALAAWQALFELGGLAEGETVLIHGAAGGVGHYAVQFAKCEGARVIGTASAGRHDFLRQLGADEVIDYTATPFEEWAREVDVVLDTIGGETQRRSWRTLKPGGILVSLLEQPPAYVLEAHGVRGQLLMGHADPALLARIGGLVDAGQVAPHVSVILPLKDVVEAHARVASRRTQGKIVFQLM